MSVVTDYYNLAWYGMFVSGMGRVSPVVGRIPISANILLWRPGSGRSATPGIWYYGGRILTGGTAFACVAHHSDGRLWGRDVEAVTTSPLYGQGGACSRPILNADRRFGLCKEAMPNQGHGKAGKCWREV